MTEREREAGRLLKVQLRSITYEALEIRSYEFRAVDGTELPPFEAGAHVDIHLPSGHRRSYSLVNPTHERHRYVVAVSKAPDSQGGSRYIHESLRGGEVLTLEGPRNNFRLTEDASHTLMIAGGIGITPIWSMIQRLEALKRRWELYYCARTRRHAAFLEELNACASAGGGAVHSIFDQEPDGSPLDIGALVRSAPAETHLYCCGPHGMLAAFEAACRDLPPSQVHVEYFKPKSDFASTGGFSVRLAKSGRIFEVGPSETILSVLLAAGISVPNSCRQGVCGSCETRVISGTPAHRDSVLGAQERASGATMMICCSGSKSDNLVLDL
jgi:ferredoxin-NADP reductase